MSSTTPVCAYPQTLSSSGTHVACPLACSLAPVFTFDFYFSRTRLMISMPVGNITEPHRVIPVSHPTGIASERVLHSDDSTPSRHRYITGHSAGRVSQHDGGTPPIVYGETRELSFSQGAVQDFTTERHTRLSLCEKHGFRFGRLLEDRIAQARLP